MKTILITGILGLLLTAIYPGKKIYQASTDGRLSIQQMMICGELTNQTGSAISCVPGKDQDHYAVTIQDGAAQKVLQVNQKTGTVSVNE